MWRIRKPISLPSLVALLGAIGWFCVCSTSAEADDFLEMLNGLRPANSLPVEREMETDRDSFTPATSLVEESQWMVESAWSFIDNRNTPETHSLPELLFRYGVSDWLEVRFGTNYEIGGEGGSVSQGGSGHHTEMIDAEIEEEANINYGIKLAISEQQGWIPQSALILTGATPTSGVEENTEFVGTFAFGWLLENDWVWDSSIRYGTRGDGIDASQGWAPSSVIKIPLSERTKIHAEYFGIFKSGPEGESEEHYLSPGIHHLVTENLEIGIRVGWGLNPAAPKFFSNIGFGLVF